jgi:hypothetical protein
MDHARTLAVALAAVTLVTLGRASDSRPNIVMIMIADQGFHAALARE